MAVAHRFNYEYFALCLYSLPTCKTLVKGAATHFETACSAYNLGYNRDSWQAWKRFWSSTTISQCATQWA
jgi:hypothetical protein